MHPFTVADAERVLSGEVDPHDGWEGGYAFTDEPELLSEYVRRGARIGDPAPYGPYLVRRSARRRDDRGSEPVRSARRRRCRRVRVRARARGARPGARDAHGAGPSRWRASAGASIARAETEVRNLPARRALEKAGIAEATRVADIVTYEIRL